MCKPFFWNSGNHCGMCSTSKYYFVKQPFGTCWGQPHECGPHVTFVKRTAIQLSKTDSATCALLDDSSIKCWGVDVNWRSGHLGYGDTVGLTNATSPHHRHGNKHDE
eukprot:1562236-Amphidinium_carterae.1